MAKIAGPATQVRFRDIGVFPTLKLAGLRVAKAIVPNALPSVQSKLFDIRESVISRAKQNLILRAGRIESCQPAPAQMSNAPIEEPAPICPAQDTSALSSADREKILLERLVNITGKMLSLDTRKVFKTILEGVKELGFERAYIYKLTMREGQPYLKIIDAVNPTDIALSRYSTEKKLEDDMGKLTAIASGEPYFESQADVDEAKQKENGNLLPGIIIPLVAENGEQKVLGLLKVDNFDRPFFQDDSGSHIKMFHIFANLAGEALRLAEMHKSLSEAEKEEFGREVLKQLGHYLNNQVGSFDMTAQMIEMHCRKVLDAVKAKMDAIGGVTEDNMRSPAILAKKTPVTVKELSDIVSSVEKIENYIKGVFDSIEALKRMMKEVEDLRAGVRPEVAAPVSSVFKDALSRLSEEDVMKKIGGSIEIKEDYSENDGIIVPVDLGRALSKILVNSVQAIARSGADGGKVLFRAEKCDGFVYLSVIDNGGGMTQETLELVKQFELFRSVGADLAKNFGFGLSGAHRIVKALGGEIDITSDIGQGTEVVIRVPVR